MSRNIDYGNLMHEAMRGLIRKVLTDVAENGLPGAHHFFITFDTSHPDAELADWLSDRYPGEMTVVMQHWYDNLDVGAEGFAVTLNFGDAPEPLYIPYPLPPRQSPRSRHPRTITTTRRTASPRTSYRWTVSGSRRRLLDAGQERFDSARDLAVYHHLKAQVEPPFGQGPVILLQAVAAVLVHKQ